MPRLRFICAGHDRTRLPFETLVEQYLNEHADPLHPDFQSLARESSIAANSLVGDFHVISSHTQDLCRMYKTRCSTLFDQAIASDGIWITAIVFSRMAT